MAQGFTLKEKGLADVMKRIGQLGSEVKINGSKELNKFGFAVDANAKQLIASNSSDEGGLLRSVKVIAATPSNLTVAIVVTADYAAYIEFGTRKFAAIQVAKLPSDWQKYAAQFKGGGGGSFAEFVQSIIDWVKRKGIDEKAAYPIALSILRNGIRAKPFLYPSVIKSLPKLTEGMQKLVK